MCFFLLCIDGIWVHCTYVHCIYVHKYTVHMRRSGKCSHKTEIDACCGECCGKVFLEPNVSQVITRLAARKKSSNMFTHPEITWSGLNSLTLPLQRLKNKKLIKLSIDYWANRIFKLIIRLIRFFYSQQIWESIKLYDSVESMSEWNLFRNLLRIKPNNR